MEQSAGESRGIRVVTIIGILGALVLFGGTWAAYRLLIQAPAEMAHAAAEGVRTLFQVTPRVTVNETVIIEQTSPILEIATISRPVLVDYEWSHSWLGSTKTLHIRGTFTAKAGYDLKKPFEIAISTSPLNVKARLPNPELLSLQTDSLVELRDENGWWNRLTDEDRTSVLSTLQALARQKAVATGILDEVRTSAEARIRELVARNGAETEFEKAGSPNGL
jgi:predicted Fe-S protein YdhL (DUF1289 family)